MEGDQTVTVHDLWDDLTKADIAERRAKNAPRYQRRWREGTGRSAPQRKQSYKEHQKAQAYLDDANQMQRPKARAIRAASLTVDTLLDRHLAAKADRAPKTVEADQHHAMGVRHAFGDRVISTIDATEIEIWSQRAEPAASSRKKQLELLRAAIKRGVRDKLVDVDVTEGLVVSLRHVERPHWSSEELRAVIAAASNDIDAVIFRVLGFMGLREKELLTLRVGDLVGSHLTVRDSKTRAGIRTLPVPAGVLSSLVSHAGTRPKAEPLFQSPRRSGHPVAKGYVNAALARAVARANATRTDPIQRLSAHGLRHTFAAIALSEAGGNLLSVSRALGHARPSITLDRYGHLAPGGLEPLMAMVDAFTGAEAA